MSIPAYGPSVQHALVTKQSFAQSIAQAVALSQPIPINSSMIRLARQLPCPEKMILARPARHASIGALSPTSQRAVQNSIENTWNIMEEKIEKKKASAWPKIGQMLAVLMEYDVLRPAEGKTRPVTSGINGQNSSKFNFNIRGRV